MRMILILYYIGHSCVCVVATSDCCFLNKARIFCKDWIDRNIRLFAITKTEKIETWKRG